MDEEGSFKKLQANVSSALVETTRTVGQIASEDLAFHRTSNPAVAPLLDRQASRLLNLAQSLTKISVLGTDLRVPRLSDPESVEDEWKSVVDVIDNLLEKADACLDEYTGAIKKSQSSQIDKQADNGVPSKRQWLGNNLRNQTIAKPQLLFSKVPNNDESRPFKPLLHSKPHAITPLEESLVLEETEDGAHLYKNPYESEIVKSQYPHTMYIRSDPIPFLPFESTQATLIDSPEAIISMLSELKKAREIAVDLEHHDSHSFAGLVSLMQISTREKDWIVDTLKPWREDLQILNEVFTDPSIIKVFHGAFMDMIWLQRDLGLYVVSLFDTFHASRCLQYPRNSLAALLKHFVNFNADKKYQMADWRIRPLPKEMFNYARSDTHFLLYIYDHLRNELLDKSDISAESGKLIDQVLQKSKLEALQRYVRPIYDEKHGRGPGGWHNMLSHTPALFNREQFAVFRAVHQWRDQVARIEDEGLAHVMQKHVLYNIARNLPLDIPTLLGCSHPISPILRLRSAELLNVIKNAKTAGATGPEMQELIQPVEKRQEETPRYTKKSNNTETPLNDVSPASTTKTVVAAQVPSHALLVKTNTSHFWDTLLNDSAFIQQTKEMQRQLTEIRFELPLPQLTAQVFENPQRLESPIDSAVISEDQDVKAEGLVEDDVIIVKQHGGSRKRKAIGLPEFSNVSLQENIKRSYNLPEDSNFGIGAQEQGQEQEQATGVAQQPTSKNRKRQETRERNRARVQSQNGIDGQGQDEAAFDYERAPSMLQVKSNQPDRKGVSKAFNPYAKSLNVPRGMRKSNREIGGRSFTFKG